MDLKFSAHTYFMMRNSNLNSVSTENQHEILNIYRDYNFSDFFKLDKTFSMIREMSICRFILYFPEMTSNAEILQFPFSYLNARHSFNEYARTNNHKTICLYSQFSKLEYSKTIIEISSLFESKDRILSKTRGKFPL